MNKKCICGGLFYEIEGGLLRCHECLIIVDPNAPVGEEARRLEKEFERKFPNFGYDYGRPWEELG